MVFPEWVCATSVDPEAHIPGTSPQGLQWPGREVRLLVSYLKKREAQPCPRPSLPAQKSLMGSG